MNFLIRDISRNQNDDTIWICITNSLSFFSESCAWVDGELEVRDECACLPFRHNTYIEHAADDNTDDLQLHVFDTNVSQLTYVSLRNWRSHTGEDTAHCGSAHRLKNRLEKWLEEKRDNRLESVVSKSEPFLCIYLISELVYIAIMVG